MGEETFNRSRKRKTTTQDESQAKRAKNSSSEEEEDDMINELIPGKIKRIFLKNFMCHDALEMHFNSRINFLVGSNGSGKSAVLTALTVGLGAKARDTDRGASLKGFVKQGKTSATVEITITNRGDKSYEWETYGDTITIVRTIGAASYYKIKSHTGATISTKKEELDKIVKALNIQVDNPISILNQDAARSFLMTNKPDDLYRFYMKATRLDIVGENYRSARAASDNAKMELEQSRKFLKKNENIIKELQQKIKALESLDMYREEYQKLDKEVLWAAVIEEEKKMLHIDKKIDSQNKDIEKLKNIELDKATQEKEITSKIEEQKAKIADIEAEAASSHEKAEDLKQKYMNKKKMREEKREKAKKIHENIRTKEKDLTALENEINKLESEATRLDERRQAATLKRENAEQQLDEVEATLRTKQTDRMHLEENRNRIGQEETKSKIEIDEVKSKINKNLQKLLQYKNQPNDALAVFGPNFSRIVRRIDEEHKKGRFKKKPVGPLGSYISVRDKKWIPAIETHISFNMLRSFCVDNSDDAKILRTIMKEICGNNVPPIITSKFIDTVHDVSRRCARSPKYPNIFDLLDVSNDTAVNALIDNRGIEGVLLIETSEEACKVMGEARNVPRNCRLAYTLKCDQFFPDPNYKSYGGSGGKAKFLQVSAVDIIQGAHEEINNCKIELQMLQKQHAAIVQRKEQTQRELNQVEKQVKYLLSKRIEHKETITESTETLNSFNNNIINEHKNEIEQIQKWLEHNKVQENQLMEEFRQAHKEMEAASEAFKKCRELATGLDAKTNPFKEKIRELKDEQKRLDAMSKGATKRLQEAKQLLQKLNGEHKQLQRVVTTKTELANACCPRIESIKSVREIQNRVAELKAFIEDVEKEHGDKETLKEQLKEHDEKYADVRKTAENLEILNERHNERSRIREAFYRKMKKDVAEKVQDAFSNILLLRKYKGTVIVDYKKGLLNLEMKPMNDAQRLTNDAKALSGGERSYSTIGFILALWNCTGLPFYFLDEFDVFMDKINRRVIMDILIDHAMRNGQSQFTFLTPLDASHVKANNSITIHRMAPPARG